MSACRNFRTPGERRQSPHPLHAGLAEILVLLKIPFECEARFKTGSPYFVDFLFRESGVIVEIDGSLHDAERDKVRDGQIERSCYVIQRFPCTMSVREIAGQVLLTIAENATVCHRCRKQDRTGPRYCPTCSAEKQEDYRTKRLKLPSRPTLEQINEPEMLEKIKREANSPVPSWAWKHPKAPLR